jgi:hypothetical protein
VVGVEKDMIVGRPERSGRDRLNAHVSDIGLAEPAYFLGHFDIRRLGEKALLNHRPAAAKERAQ